MLLNRIEKAMMNNPVRAALQRHFEAPRLRSMGGPPRAPRRSRSGAGAASAPGSSSTSSRPVGSMPSTSTPTWSRSPGGASRGGARGSGSGPGTPRASRRRTARTTPSSTSASSTTSPHVVHAIREAFPAGEPRADWRAPLTGAAAARGTGSTAQGR